MASFGLARDRCLSAVCSAALGALGRGALRCLRCERRRVLVTVLVGGREVDGFAVANAATLAAALRPIYAHLPEHGAAVRLRGVRETWLPLGLGRVSEEMSLASADAALAYLGSPAAGC